MKQDQKKKFNTSCLPFEKDQGVHGPGQVDEGLVGSDCIHSPLGNQLRLERREELGKPTGEGKEEF